MKYPKDGFLILKLIPRGHVPNDSFEKQDRTQEELVVRINIDTRQLYNKRLQPFSLLSISRPLPL